MRLYMKVCERCHMIEGARMAWWHGGGEQYGRTKGQTGDEGRRGKERQEIQVERVESHFHMP